MRPSSEAIRTARATAARPRPALLALASSSTDCCRPGHVALSSLLSAATCCPRNRSMPWTVAASSSARSLSARFDHGEPDRQICRPAGSRAESCGRPALRLSSVMRTRMREQMRRSRGNSSRAFFGSTHFSNIGNFPTIASF